MEIAYYGRGCFRLKGKEQHIVLDLHQESLKKTLLKSENVVLVETEGHCEPAELNGSSGVQRARGAGEFEFKGVEVKGTKIGDTTMMAVTVDDVRCVTLGRTSTPPEDSAVDSLGHVDVLFVPVGGGSVLSAHDAVLAIREIEPCLVIPMYYRIADDRETAEFDELSVFLKEFGIDDVNPLPKVSVSPTSGEEEVTATVVLEPQG